MQEQNISAAEIRRRYLERQEEEETQLAGDVQPTVEMETAETANPETGAGNTETEMAEATLSLVMEEQGGDSLIAEAQAAVQEARDAESGAAQETGPPAKKQKKTKAKKKNKKHSDSDDDMVIPTPHKKRAIRRRNFAGSESDSDSDVPDPDFLNSEFHDVENNEQLFREVNKDQGRIPGQTDFCASCHCKFTVTLTSEPAPPHLQIDDKQHLLLCPSCTKEARDKGKAKRTGALSADAIAASRMQRKRVAAALLDRKELTVPSLMDICISLISTHIDDVEALGDIGTANQKKLSRILSRNRSLNSKTIKLFLDPAAKELEFWDCSEVNKDSLNLIAAYCPNIESLTLSMCGHLTNDNLSYFAANLRKLKSITLDGPFLVSSEAWGKFFLAMAGQLERVDIRNSHRFDSEAFAILVESFPQLTHLTLHRMSGLTDPAAFLMIPLLTNLVHLDLSHPPQDIVMAGEIDLITDETMTVILNSIGSQLETLVLDGCSELSDAFITDALRPCCCGSRLTRLSLASLDRITDSVVADLFNTWYKRHDSSLTRLSNLTLDRCYSLGDLAMQAMFNYTRPAIVQLSIASLPDVSVVPFQAAFVDAAPSKQFPNLTDANFSFVRAMTNRLVEGLVDRAPSLEYIEVFGVPKVNRACSIKSGVKIIGRQDDYM